MNLMRENAGLGCNCERCARMNRRLNGQLLDIGQNSSILQLTCSSCLDRTRPITPTVRRGKRT